MRQDLRCTIVSRNKIHLVYLVIQRISNSSSFYLLSQQVSLIVMLICYIRQRDIFVNNSLSTSYQHGTRGFLKDKQDPYTTNQFRPGNLCICENYCTPTRWHKHEELSILTDARHSQSSQSISGETRNAFSSWWNANPSHPSLGHVSVERTDMSGSMWRETRRRNSTRRADREEPQKYWWSSWTFASWS